jgi:hypothetical protein
MIRRPTSGNTSTGASLAPGVQRELDNEAALLRERATLAPEEKHGRICKCEKRVCQCLTLRIWIRPQCGRKTSRA